MHSWSLPLKKKSWWLWPKKNEKKVLSIHKRLRTKSWTTSLSSSQWISWRHGKKYMYIHIYIYIRIVWGVQQKNSEVLRLHKGFWHPKNFALWSLLLCHPVNFLCEPLERSVRRECPQCYLTVVHNLLPPFSGHKPRNPENISEGNGCLSRALPPRFFLPQGTKLWKNSYCFYALAFHVMRSPNNLFEENMLTIPSMYYHCLRVCCPFEVLV